MVQIEKKSSFRGTQKKKINEQKKNVQGASEKK